MRMLVQVPSQVWIKDTRTRTPCRREEFVGIETRVLV